MQRRRGLGEWEGASGYKSKRSALQCFKRHSMAEDPVRGTGSRDVISQSWMLAFYFLFLDATLGSCS